MIKIDKKGRLRLSEFTKRLIIIKKNFGFIQKT